jgi:iron complex transport system substrate-binding protein
VSARPLARLALALAIVATMALPAPQDRTPRTVRDDLGRPFELAAAPPVRIVSMAPNITEILFALGLGGRVVGVTRFCDYPPEALTVAKVGGLVDPNIEIIESLRPDLVLAFRGNPLRFIDRLAELRLPVFVLDVGTGLDGLFGLIGRIGLVTGKQAEAAALASRLRTRLDALQARLETVTRRPRVFIILHSQGLWTSGGEGYINDLAARAGAVNIAAAIPKKWVLYSRERILADNPDAVFVLTRSPEEFAAARRWMAGEARLGSIAAVRRGNVFALDQDAASRFGPRLVDVLERMARDLHPERFEALR